MTEKELQQAIVMLEDLLKEARSGKDGGDWPLRWRMGRTMIAIFKAEQQYLKLKTERPAVSIHFFEPSCPLTASETSLYAKVLELSREIHRERRKKR